MRLPFRQGVVRTNEQFINVNGSLLDLIPIDVPVRVAIAHKTTDYLHTENVRVDGAWSVPDGITTPMYMYIDLSKDDATRTFGHTMIEPLFGPTAPAVPIDTMHWFDTINMVMKEYVGAANEWRERIRVFITNYTPGNPVQYYPADTQVGVYEPSRPTGSIVYDRDGKAIKNSAGEFFTTESDFHVANAYGHSMRLESGIVQAQAGETLPAFHVVYYSDFDEVMLADYEHSDNSVVGMTLEGSVIGTPVTVVLAGEVSNVAWDWTTEGVGTPLWVDRDGELTHINPYQQSGDRGEVQAAVAKVSGKHTIIFEQADAGIRGEPGPTGEQGPPGEPGADGASGATVVSGDIQNNVLTLTKDDASTVTIDVTEISGTNVAYESIPLDDIEKMNLLDTVDLLYGLDYTGGNNASSLVVKHPDGYAYPTPENFTSPDVPDVTALGESDPSYTPGYFWRPGPGPGSGDFAYAENKTILIANATANYGNTIAWLDEETKTTIVNWWPGLEGISSRGQWNIVQYECTNGGNGNQYCDAPFINVSWGNAADPSGALVGWESGTFQANSRDDNANSTQKSGYTTAILRGTKFTYLAENDGIELKLTRIVSSTDTTPVAGSRIFIFNTLGQLIRTESVDTFNDVAEVESGTVSNMDLVLTKSDASTVTIDMADFDFTSDIQNAATVNHGVLNIDDLGQVGLGDRIERFIGSDDTDSTMIPTEIIVDGGYDTPNGWIDPDTPDVTVPKNEPEYPLNTDVEVATSGTTMQNSFLANGIPLDTPQLGTDGNYYVVAYSNGGNWPFGQSGQYNTPEWTLFNNATNYPLQPNGYFPSSLYSVYNKCDGGFAYNSGTDSCDLVDTNLVNWPTDGISSMVLNATDDELVAHEKDTEATAAQKLGRSSVIMRGSTNVAYIFEATADDLVKITHVDNTTLEEIVGSTMLYIDDQGKVIRTEVVTASVVSGAMVSDDLVLTKSDSTTVTIDMSSLAGLSSVVDDTTPQLGGTLSGGGNAINDVELRRYNETLLTPTVAGTTTINFAVGSCAALTLTQNTTLSFSTPPPAGVVGSYTLIFQQDATGSHVVTLPASVTRGTLDLAPGPNQQTIATLVTIDGGVTYTVMTAFTEGA